MKVKDLLKDLLKRDPEEEVYTLSWDGEVTPLDETKYLVPVMVLEENGSAVEGAYRVIPGYPIIDQDTGKKIKRKYYLTHCATPSTLRLIKESKKAKFVRRLAIAYV
jgi:hypothetical protein